jgi:hypothetical protein
MYDYFLFTIKIEKCDFEKILMMLYSGMEGVQQRCLVAEAAEEEV